MSTPPAKLPDEPQCLCYSFTAVTQRAEKLMTDGGLAHYAFYFGAEKVIPHYNVMGVAKRSEASVRYLRRFGAKNIRVNSIPGRLKHWPPRAFPACG